MPDRKDRGDKRMKFRGTAISVLGAALLAALTGCVTADGEARAMRESLLAGNVAPVAQWSRELATESSYSKNLGKVEAGKVALLAGESGSAEQWFRAAVDSAVDRSESDPKINVGDAANAALAGTLTDDRTMEYYLAPYELNLALAYGIVAQLMNGKREDALVDARLSVYVQDTLSKTYGEDMRKPAEEQDEKAASAGSGICANETSALSVMMESTRNSWENPVLWWLSGALFEADGDLEMAWQSYRKAAACRPENKVFAADAARADKATVAPARGRAKLLVVYEEGLMPLRESLKIPVPLYTAMSIDIPTYADKSPYVPGQVQVSVATNRSAAVPALDVRALAVRDLSERLPGVVARNITRAAVAAGAQAAVNAAGNEYAKAAVLLANAIATAVRRADTRTWISLPDGQQVWSAGDIAPGDYSVGVTANGRSVSVPVSLKAGDAKLLWISDCGSIFKTAAMSLK